MAETTLQRVLRERGITQAQLAEQTGLSKSTVNQWATGLRGESLDAPRRIAEALGMGIDMLFPTDAGQERQPDPAEE